MEAVIKQKKNSLFKSVMWMAFSNFAARIMFFISGVITARLLSTEDFGIIGMAATFTNFITFTGSVGITNYLIYKQNLSDDDIRSIYLVQTLLGLFLGSALIIGSPFIANVYKTPEVAHITFIAGLSLFVSWIGWYPRSYLLKQMKQNVVAKIETAVSFINIFFIVTLAFLGFKYLSYVIPLLISQTVGTVLFLSITKLKPALKIKPDLFKDVFKYGKSFMPQQFLLYFTSQMDYVFAGYFLGKTVLGYYYFGFEKAVLIIIVLKAIITSSFGPIFAELQSEKHKLKDKFISLNNKLSFVFFPVMFLMVVTAKEFISFIFGAKWDNSVLTFQIILSFCILKILFEMCIALFNSTGRPDQNLKHYMIIMPIYIAGFFAGIKLGGVIGLAIAAFIVNNFSSILMLFRVKKVFNWPIKDIFGNSFKILLILASQLVILIPLKLLLIRAEASNFIILVVLCSLILILYLFTTKYLLNDLYKGVVVYIRDKVNNLLKRAENEPKTT